MVAGHLQEKKGYFYMVLNLKDENGVRKNKWIPTHLPVKGNKRKAEAMLQEERKKVRLSTDQRRQSDAFFRLYALLAEKGQAGHRRIHLRQLRIVRKAAHRSLLPQPGNPAVRSEAHSHSGILHLLSIGIWRQQ